MPETAQLQETLTRLSDHGSIAMDVALVFGLLFGVFLWLFGARIVRPNIAMLGIIFGSIAAGLVARTMSLTPIAAYALGGAVIGGLLMWFTWRLWVALLLATVFGVLAPLTVMAWHNTPLPETEQPILELRQSATENVQELIVSEDSRAQTLGDLLQEVLDRIAVTIDTWWDARVSPVARTGMIIGGLAAAAVGLAIGLIFPKIGSALVSSSIGSVFLLISLSGLAQRYVPSVVSDVPAGIRSAVAAIIAATILGSLIQWTILRSKADE